MAYSHEASGVVRFADNTLGTAVLLLDQNGNPLVIGGAGGTSSTDDAAFTAGASSLTPVGGIVTADSVDSGDVGAFAMLANRQQKVSLYDSSGNELSVGGGTQYTEDAAAAANPVGNAIIVVRDDARGGSLTTTDGDNVALRGTNAGEVYVKHVDALTVSSHAVTNAGTFAVQSAGAVAHDAADSGNPVKIGARARASEIGAVSSDDRVDLIADLVGKLIVLPYANPENFVSGAITSAMTSTTSTSLIAAPASGLRNYITQITVSNASITVPTDILIQDGSGGTTLYVVPAPCGTGTGTGASGGTYVFPTPLRQPTTATAIFVANVTTGSSTKVSASGYIGR